MIGKAIGIALLSPGVPTDGVRPQGTQRAVPVKQLTRGRQSPTPIPKCLAENDRLCTHRAPHIADFASEVRQTFRPLVVRPFKRVIPDANQVCDSGDISVLTSDAGLLAVIGP